MLNFRHGCKFNLSMCIAAAIMEKRFHVMVRDYMASYLQEEGMLGYLSHKQEEGFITLSLNEIGITT